MTTSALIDLILAYTDNTTSADTDNATRRTRLLQYTQEVFDQVWYHKQWPFRSRSTTVAVSASSNVADLPSDFAEIGEKGGVYDGTTQLTEVSELQLIAERQAASSALAPYIFALFGFNTTTNLQRLQVLTQTAAVTYTLNYQALAPTLVDATGSTNNLDKMPAQYHNLVLVPGVAAAAKVSLGDVPDPLGAFNRGLNNMVIQARPRKTAVHRMPLARGGMC